MWRIRMMFVLGAVDKKGVEFVCQKEEYEGK